MPAYMWGSRRQLAGIGSLLLCGSSGLGSGCQRLCPLLYDKTFDSHLRQGSHNPPKSSLVNQWVFIGVTCRGRNDSDSYITKPTPAWVTTPKGCVHCTACGQLSRLENVLSRYLCWSNPLPGSWPGLWVFAAQLPFFQEDSQLLCLLRQGGPRFWSVSGTSYGYFDLFTFLLELPRTDGMFQSFSMSKEP